MWMGPDFSPPTPVSHAYGDTRLGWKPIEWPEGEGYRSQHLRGKFGNRKTQSDATHQAYLSLAHVIWRSLICPDFWAANQHRFIIDNFSGKYL